MEFKFAGLLQQHSRWQDHASAEAGLDQATVWSA